MNKKILFNFVIVLVLLGVVFNFVGKSGEIKSIKIAGQEVKVDLAITAGEQEMGLSGRENLLENTGMLFVFEKEGIYPFWMKDMNFPIDMIWINGGMRVVYIQENATPESYPEIFDPKTNAKYVLEVPAGFSKNNNLKVGDKVLLRY